MASIVSGVNFDATKDVAKTPEQKPLSAADELKAIEAEKAEFDMLQAEEQEKFGKAQEEYQKKLAEVDEAVKKEEERRAEEAKKKEIEATAAKEARRKLAEQEARKKRSLATLFKEEVADPVVDAGEGLKDMLIGGGSYR